MLALSIRQPYAALILRGIRTVELRSRATTIIGRRFYVCVGLDTAVEADLALPFDRFNPHAICFRVRLDARRLGEPGDAVSDDGGEEADERVFRETDTGTQLVDKRM